MTWQIHEGCALSVLPTLAEASAHCCVTSPPFFNLRRYEGVQATDWPAVTYAPMPGLPPLTVPAMSCCLGNEPTPEAYVGHLVAIFREVRRVLRDDGTCWVNLGDSFAGNGTQGRKEGKYGSSRLSGHPVDSVGPYLATAGAKAVSRKAAGVKPKDLLLIPPRFALAMQADGWFVRQVINWQKCSPMPQSCRDRPTSATEEIYLLSRKATYYYDLDACRVPNGDDSGWAKQRAGGVDTWEYNNTPERIASTGQRTEASTFGDPNGRNLWSWWDISPDPSEGDDGLMPAKLRWLLASEPTRVKHYAAFPGEIPYRALKLGTSARGVCGSCGAPWRRVVEKESHVGVERGTQPSQFRANLKPPQQSSVSVSTRTLGWRQGCGCPPSPPVPATALDPFCGTATVGAVARALGLNFVGVEASPAYAAVCRERLAAVNPIGDCEQAAPPAARSLFDEVNS